jgi:hypothetical protein
VFLQETWLHDYESAILNKIHGDYYGRGVCAMNDDNEIVGRPYGGLAILWRKSLSKSSKIILYDDCRIMGIEISESLGRKLLFVNGYLPYDSCDNFDMFVFYLQMINTIITDFPLPVQLCNW